MKKLWKIYDLSLIFIVLALCLCVMTASHSTVLAIAQAVLVLGFALAKFFYYKDVRDRLLFKVKTVSNELDFQTGKAFSVLSIP